LPAVLETVKPKDIWTADRNICTVGFTCGTASKGAFFIIREHKNYPYRPAGPEFMVGETETGTVYEQDIVAQHGAKSVVRGP